MHNYRLPLSSLFAWVCLLRLVACLDVVHSSNHHDHHHHPHHKPSLCRASPKEQQEYADARYESATPSGRDEALDKFLAEWHRDLREEDTVRYQPVATVCSPALQNFPAFISTT